MGLNRSDFDLLKPIDLVEKLDDNGKRHFYLALDYMADHILRHDAYPSLDALHALTDNMDIARYVERLLHSQRTTDQLLDTVARLQRWKPPFLALAPGSGGLLPRPGLPTMQAARPPIQRTDAPLGGAVLGDGAAVSWNDRLAHKSAVYSSDQLLFGNYAEAAQVLAELANLQHKGRTGAAAAATAATNDDASTAAADRANAFPTDPAAQRVLVADMCNAITNMDGILETRPSPPLPTRGTGGAGSAVPNQAATATAATTATMATPGLPAKRKRDAGDDHDTDNGNKAMQERLKKPCKENVSVAKVKGLSRIEVEVLSWVILSKVHITQEGHLSFLPWSGKDWGWEKFSTFRDRFDAVIRVLRESKAAVCSLLESDYMARLTAHPNREIRRKENNRSQNAERNAQVFVGRYAISAGQVQVTNGGNLEDRDGNVVASAATDHTGLIAQTAKLHSICKMGGKKQLRDAEKRGVLPTTKTTTKATATATATDAPSTTPEPADDTADDSPRTQTHDGPNAHDLQRLRASVYGGILSPPPGPVPGLVPDLRAPTLSPRPSPSPQLPQPLLHQGQQQQQKPHPGPPPFWDTGLDPGLTFFHDPSATNWTNLAGVGGGVSGVDAYNLNSPFDNDGGQPSTTGSYNNNGDGGTKTDDAFVWPSDMMQPNGAATAASSPSAFLDLDGAGLDDGALLKLPWGAEDSHMDGGR